MFNVAEGQVIHHQGQVGTRFYVVVSGSLAVLQMVTKSPSVFTTGDETGFTGTESGTVETKVQVLEYSCDGEEASEMPCFGEMALIHSLPRAATVQASRPSVVWSLHRLQLEHDLARQRWKKAGNVVMAANRFMANGKLRRLRQIAERPKSGTVSPSSPATPGSPQSAQELFDESMASPTSPGEIFRTTNTEDTAPNERVRSKSILTSGRTRSFGDGVNVALGPASPQRKSKSVTAMSIQNFQPTPAEVASNSQVPPIRLSAPMNEDERHFGHSGLQLEAKKRWRLAGTVVKAANRFQLAGLERAERRASLATAEPLITEDPPKQANASREVPVAVMPCSMWCSP